MTTTTADITTIERELRQLWKENAAGAAGGQAVTRALTLNLVIRAHDRATGDQVSEIVQQLTASHPSRAVLALIGPAGGAPRLEAYVQANCLLSAPGVPQVCGEQVTIEADGETTAQVASLVLPLLVPDLPVDLWLPGPDPFSDPLLARLRGVVDRLIVDSRAFAAPARDLTAMAAFDRSEDHGPGAGARPPALSDLSWAALTPWRELIAQFFDARPLLPHLRRIDHVEITYLPTDGPASGTAELAGQGRAGAGTGLAETPALEPDQGAGRGANPIQPLLLAGWLAACLGWLPLEEAVSIEGETLRLHLRRAAVGVGPSAIRLVTVEIRPAPANPGKGPGLAGLRLRAVDGVTADFRVERTERPGHALTAALIAGHPPLSRIVRCAEPGLADLLAAELRLLSRDRMFSAALRAAAVFASRLA